MVANEHLFKKRNNEIRLAHSREIRKSNTNLYSFLTAEVRTEALDSDIDLKIKIEEI